MRDARNQVIKRAHELVARKAGFLTFTSHVVAAADTDTVIDVRLVPLEDASKLRRRWPVWKPMGGHGRRRRARACRCRLRARGAET